MEKEKNMSDELQVVVFILDKNYYGVHILQVQEIIKMTEITQLPNTPDFIKGIVNLRGNIVPIMNLRKRFGLTEQKENENAKILILKLEELQFGIIVDEISEVEKVSVSSIEAPPKIVSGVRGEFINGIAKTNDRLLILLNIEKILTLEEKEILKEIEETN
ncbi:purine-binding chemotaxis protein CheW [Hypnocyclicus thermotrophus]|uniref:Chemotaxis protein CheW n=1 Tax=Hypnocyclicus thermotrophus TaxID=1627895 RepID=A0AA46DXN8_9FUSO|nr:chemotaxis protein CheW [Hypnocyclicus thermotrophus]TDT68583.1 purine-binding chemotaxis protein CheW [Hypnocyclicus thermotrophus]